MKVIGTANRWVQCRRPNGCGWYWQKRTIRNHWWSRPRNEYRGAYWEHAGGDPRYSSRPDDSSSKRWMSQEEFDSWYGDCIGHLKEVSAVDALLDSKQ